ncbi:MAG: hypothetical protein R8K49_07085 [Mariprofundaceae bacterium]
MLITCPQCKAHYQLHRIEQSVILVCHRCNTEFATTQHQPSLITDQSKAESTLQNQPSITPTSESSPKNSPEPHIPEQAYPARKQAHIWPWLIFILISISGFGLWQHQQQWQAQPWLRSIMLQVQIPIQQHASDWKLMQDQSHSQWITRQDNSQILFIDSAIKNLLSAKQAPPTLQLRFYAAPNSPAIQSRIIAITEPPSLPNIRHAPFIAPATDLTPVMEHQSRTFSLVIENIPKHARNFTLSVQQAKLKDL